MSNPLVEVDEFLNRFGQNFQGQRLAPRITAQGPDSAAANALSDRLATINAQSSSYGSMHASAVNAEKQRREAETLAKLEEERRAREEQDRKNLQDELKKLQEREYNFDFGTGVDNSTGWTPEGGYNNTGGGYGKQNAMSLIEATGVEGPRLQVLQMAADMIGTPYTLGGGGIGKPKSRGLSGNVIGVDCSGLTSYVYGQIGIKLPRYSNHQTSVGVKTNFKNAKPGDLVGWAKGGHVAVYAGNGYIIEAPRPGKSVQLRRVGSNEKVYAVQLSFKG